MSSFLCKTDRAIVAILSALIKDVFFKPVRENSGWSSLISPQASCKLRLEILENIPTIISSSR